MGRFDGFTEEWALDRKIAAQNTVAKKKKAKYGNKKVVVDGITFDSVGEAGHYGNLKLASLAGLLTFERQVKYDLIVPDLNGKPFALQSYVADFVVTFSDGRVEVQDFKGHRTREFIFKKKWMKKCLGVEVIEVSKRTFICMEKESEYCEIGRKRISEEYSKIMF